QSTDEANEVGPAKPHVDVLLSGAFAFPAPVATIDVSLAIGRRIRKMLAVTEDQDGAQAPFTRWPIRAAEGGWAAIPAHWSQRARFAGTYDDAWRESRWPLPPEDFDPRFFNVAPIDQQL